MIEGSKLIYLVRHGESEANVAMVHGGGHHPLSAKGTEQARQIAERCAKLPLEALASSDMLRARQTAEAIAERTGLELKIVPDLHEILMPSHMRERPHNTPDAIAQEDELIENMGPGVRQSDEESFDDMIARALRVLNQITRLPEQHIALVTHGLFMRCLVGCAVFGAEITPAELLALWRGFKTSNTGISVLEYRPDTPKRLWRLLTWNDHAHLG